EISETVGAIKDLKFSRYATAQAAVKTDPIARYFLCPISSELMADPVVLSSGQTYDRAYIQEWLDTDHTTCPKTEQALKHTILTPNYLVGSMIQTLVPSQGASILPAQPAPATTVQTLRHMRPNTLTFCSTKLSGHCQDRETARELRVLTRKEALSQNFSWANP
ncbi:hypothetical protein KI387_003956, partial [Taxus chinensis]